MPGEPRTRLVVFAVSAIGIIAVSVAAAYYEASLNPRVTTVGGTIITTVATSANRFAGAVTDNVSLYVGLLDGRVQKMDPLTGRIVGSVALPDGNSAAHLLYYNGALYVGTEKLPGAKNTAPYDVYKIDPASMTIVARLQMSYPEANGLLFEHEGYIWAGLGGCTLYRVFPDTLALDGTLSSVAEDEMAFDGTYYWTECAASVAVLKPGSGMPTVVARGTLSLPNRPRGFFQLGSSMYATSDYNYTLFRMSVTGGNVSFTNVGTLGGSTLQTRDTFVRGGLLYAYETRDDAPVAAKVSVFDLSFRLRAEVPLPGLALNTDASEHSMFVLNGVVYFVTESAIGYFAPLDILKL